MKHFHLLSIALVATSLMLGACAQPSKTASNAGLTISSQNDNESGAIPTADNIAKNNQTVSTPATTNGIHTAPNWNNWNLVIVTLDKNDKPTDKFEVLLDKELKIKKDKGPEVSVKPYLLTDDSNITGRILKIDCTDNTLTQKFDNTNQLKGWAVQLSCYKKNYYFIINPVTTH